jgi:hypothetical protein
VVEPGAEPRGSQALAGTDFAPGVTSTTAAGSPASPRHRATAKRLSSAYKLPSWATFSARTLPQSADLLVYGSRALKLRTNPGSKEAPTTWLSRAGVVDWRYAITGRPVPYAAALPGLLE